MTNQKIDKILYILTALVVLIALGYFVYSDFFADKISTQDDEGSEIATTILNESEGSAVIGEVQIVTPEDQLKERADALTAPDLDRPFTARVDLPENIRKEATQTVNDAISKLKDSPLLKDSWLGLAVQRNGAEDYRGAEEIWIYVTKVWINSPVAFINLGNLYSSNLKDYAKAEQYYLSSIKINPEIIGIYKNMYSLYYLSYKQGQGLEVDILKRGLENNPNNVDLFISLANHYKDESDKVKAKDYYEQALNQAQKTNNSSVVNALEEEINNL